MVVIKVSLGEDIRRFSLASVPSFVVLRAMLEKLFDTNITGQYDVKYLDPEGDQITVTSDSELQDAFGLAPSSNGSEQSKQLRLYLVAKGTNPALMASMAAPSNSNANTSTIEADIPLSNPIVSALLNTLLGSRASSILGAGQSAPAAPSGPAESSPHPPGVYYTCDSCGTSPISGNVNQCDTCPDFHLCDTCRDSGMHMSENHTFTVNPARVSRCPRWQRRHPHFNHANNASNANNSNASPVAAPAEPKKNAVASPAPRKPEIVETTPNKSPIVPAAQLVPSELLEMSFLNDVTVPDGSEIVTGAMFSKVWRLSNSGNTTWPLGCRLSLESNTGDRLSSVQTVDIPGEVPPGSNVTISVEMEAPKKSGRHVSYWRMHGPTGTPFGSRIWVDIIATEAKKAVIAPAVPEPAAQPAQPEGNGINPNEKYAMPLESLYRMGFLNVDLNRNLLEHSKGNVAAVIDQLVSHQN